MASCDTPTPASFQSAAGSNADNGPIPAFLDLLSKWPTSIPLNNIWTVNFTTPDIDQNVLTEPFGSSYSNPANAPGGIVNQNAWELSNYRNQIKSKIESSNKDKWYKTNMLAHGITHVGDGIETKRIAIEQSRGYLPGLVTTGRREMEKMQISFLETNISYVDMVIRPWMLKIASESLIAYRPSTQGFLRSDIVCSMYAMTGPGKTPVMRKSFCYYNAFPVSIVGEKYTFTSSEIELNAVEFAFTHYAVFQGEQSHP